MTVVVQQKFMTQWKTVFFTVKNCILYCKDWSILYSEKLYFLCSEYIFAVHEYFIVISCLTHFPCAKFNNSKVHFSAYFHYCCLKELGLLLTVSLLISILNGTLLLHLVLDICFNNWTVYMFWLTIVLIFTFLYK